jgi:hypothetical protein
MSIRRCLRACSRYRPRILTLIVLAVIAATIALSNLSGELRDADSRALRYGDLQRSGGGDRQLSYGWPLVWYRHVVVSSSAMAGSIGWQYRVNSLAGNSVMWLVLLAAPGAACEWLLRRFWRGWRWSLRTMLAVVALLAGMCAWFAVARDRANLQDMLIATVEARGGTVWVERWGPEWLGLLGADRFRRRIVGAELGPNDYDPDDDEFLVVNEKLLKQNEDLLERLARLPRLRYLFMEVDHLAPGMADALGAMRELRVLSIEPMDWSVCDEPDVAHRLLAAIGKMRQLEFLCVSGLTVPSESLACLAGLDEMKWLSVINSRAHDRGVASALLSHLPPLPRLEVLDLQGSLIFEQDLRELARLPRLKSLNLDFTYAGAADLGELASAESLEQLAIGDEIAFAPRFASLRVLERLKSLHINSYAVEADHWAGAARDRDDDFASHDKLKGVLHALQALRAAKPDLLIDGNMDAIRWPGPRIMPWQYDVAGGHDGATALWKRMRQLPVPATVVEQLMREVKW